nr:uncharacterized protein LOC118966941 [Manis javanica]
MTNPDPVTGTLLGSGGSPRSTGRAGQARGFGTPTPRARITTEVARSFCLQARVRRLRAGPAGLGQRHRVLDFGWVWELRRTGFQAEPRVLQPSLPGGKDSGPRGDFPGAFSQPEGLETCKDGGISATRVLALPQPGSARNRRCGAGAAGPGPPRTPARGGWSPLGGERAGERGESLASCRRERPSSQSSGPEDRSLGTEKSVASCYLTAKQETKMTVTSCCPSVTARPEHQMWDISQSQ